MSRLPIPHFIQEIKAKLGFDRTLTASGNDVVDAVNKQSQQINKLGPNNTLTSDSTTSALSAAQGKALKGLIDNLGPINNLSTQSTTAALSAGQGKYLADNVLRYRGQVTGSMNNITNTGIYYGAGLSDCPSGTDGFGALAVFNAADAGSRASTAQFYWGYNLTRPYFRQYNHAVGAWTKWEQLVSESALHLSNSYNWINNATIVIPANHVYLFTSFRSGDIGLIISYSDGATEYKAIAGTNWSGTSQGNNTILMSATNQADYQVTALM